jgi:hypothetical protein
VAVGCAPEPPHPAATTADARVNATVVVQRAARRMRPSVNA